MDGRWYFTYLEGWEECGAFLYFLQKRMVLFLFQFRKMMKISMKIRNQLLRKTMIQFLGLNSSFVNNVCFLLLKYLFLFLYYLCFNFVLFFIIFLIVFLLIFNFFFFFYLFNFLILLLLNFLH